MSLTGRPAASRCPAAVTPAQQMGMRRDGRIAFEQGALTRTSSSQTLVSPPVSYERAAGGLHALKAIPVAPRVLTGMPSSRSVVAPYTADETSFTTPTLLPGVGALFFDKGRPQTAKQAMSSRRRLHKEMAEHVTLLLTAGFSALEAQAVRPSTLKMYVARLVELVRWMTARGLDFRSDLELDYVLILLCDE